MKTFFTRVAIFCFAVFISIGHLQAQQFDWVTGGGTNETLTVGMGTQYIEGTYFMCTDPNGNVYALSVVGNTAIYADTFYRSGAYGANSNIMLTSYNCSGQMRWAKLIAAPGESTPQAIESDSLGNIYIAGDFSTGGDLHIGYDTVTPASDYRQGIIQFDTTGKFNWVRFAGNNSLASFEGVGGIYTTLAIDGANNVHLISYISSHVVLLPGDTSYAGCYDIRYTPSGALLSAIRLPLDSTLALAGACIDKQSNKLYTYGFRGASFWTGGGGSGDSSAYNFISAFDTARNRIWIDTIGDPPAVSEGLVSGLTTDGAGHLYACGAGDGFLVYQEDTISPPAGAYGGYISFIMKLDTAGNMKWVKQCNGNSVNGFNSIALVPGNKIAATGTFIDMMNSGTTIISSGSSYDPFFAVIDTSGTLITLQRINGNGYDNEGHRIVSDNVGNLYIGGQVADTIPDTLIASYHSVGGNTDFFVLKYGVDCSCTSMPVASYTSTGTSTVSATYTGTTVGIDSVKWNFGDGTSALGTPAIHAYTVVGTVDLCVTVYTSCGYDIYCHNIVVNCTSTPVSSFSDTGSTVRGFTYTGTTTGLDSVIWNYGDGHAGTGTTPLHTYSASGTYTVCATVYTGCGSNTACNTIVVNCTPVSSFTNTGTTTRDFTYTGTTISLDSVKWNFGDGTSALGTSSIHTYSMSGTYTVCATAYTACGSNTSCSTVIINCTPTSSFTFSGTSPIDFVYNGTTTCLDSVVWNFGDGSTATGTSPSHTYSASGTYTVCATVYATCGSNTYCQNVTVSCSPTASFSYSGLSPVDFVYTGTTTGLDSVVWNYGDGGTGTGSTASYTYTATGTYTVCVTVYTTCGNNTVCNVVTIPCLTPPIASFTDTGTTTIGFTYTGTVAGIDSVLWIYGDGSTDTGMITFHTYTASDSYTVCVVAYTPCGNDSSCSEVAVIGLGVPVLSMSSVQVFPNPTTDELFITGILQQTSYRLLNVTGECMQQSVLKSGSNTLSMKVLVPGIYILEMTGADGGRNIVRAVKE